MEMRCYRKILHISYKDHVTNEEVRAKILQAMGPHKDLLTIVKRCKLQWYGHVSCSSGPVKQSCEVPDCACYCLTDRRFRENKTILIISVRFS